MSATQSIWIATDILPDDIPDYGLVDLACGLLRARDDRHQQLASKVVKDGKKKVLSGAPSGFFRVIQEEEAGKYEKAGFLVYSVDVTLKKRVTGKH